MYDNICHKPKIIIMLCLVLFCVGSVIAKTTGTVYTKDGTKYENVSFSKNNQLKIISFTYLDKKIYISFVDIDKIYDQSDNDITIHVLGKYYQKQNHKNQNKNGTKKQNKGWLKDINTKRWNAALLVHSSYIYPSGDYYKGFDGGKSFGADIIVALSDETSLRFSYGSAGIKIPSYLLLFYSDDPTIEIVNQSIDYSAKRYFFSVQVQESFDIYEKDNSFWYLYGGIGSVADKLTIDLSIRDTNTNLIYSDQSVANESLAAVRFGGGLVKMLTPVVGVNVEFSWDIVGAFKEEIKANLVDLKLGLAFVI